MIKTLLEESRKAGLKTLELEVFADNSNAIHLYENLGFKQVGTIPKKVFRKGVFHDIIVMSLVL
jgi:RimJ/RimL family protein N-acetyltransferase